MMRFITTATLALALAFVLGSTAAADLPRSCVELSDTLESHLGYRVNVGFFQEHHRSEPEDACRTYHRDNVRGIFTWAFDIDPASVRKPVPWPSTCVEFIDIMEAQLGDAAKVGIYQRVHNDATDAERACQSDHRENVRIVFGWAIDFAPPDEWLAVAAGDNHTCAIRTNGFVGCWGGNWDGQAAPPLGVFASISAGGDSTCGLRPDGQLKCWGWIGGAPEGKFSSVSVGDFHACAVRAEGTAECWGIGDDDRATPPPGQFTAVSAGSGHACGLRPDGTAACWGNDFHGETRPPSGAFTSIDAGTLVTCGLRSDGTV